MRCLERFLLGAAVSALRSRSGDHLRQRDGLSASVAGAEFCPADVIEPSDQLIDLGQEYRFPGPVRILPDEHLLRFHRFPEADFVWCGAAK
jgi:hypothetical protein